MRIMKVSELREILAVYDGNLPVTFSSSEIGGRWPTDKTPMVIGTDEDVYHVVAPQKADECLCISLHRKG